LTLTTPAAAAAAAAGFAQLRSITSVEGKTNVN
jgi:hypothetical protein